MCSAEIAVCSFIEGSYLFYMDSAYRAVNTPPPRSYRTSLLMCTAEIAVCSETPARNTQKQCEYYVEFLNVNAGCRVATVVIWTTYSSSPPSPSPTPPPPPPYSTPPYPSHSSLSPLLLLLRILLLLLLLLLLLFWRWTSFISRFWPSQRHPSTMLYPGHRLTNFWSSFDQGPVWCPPIYIWVFLSVSRLRDSI